MHGMDRDTINRHFAMAPFVMPWLYAQWVCETQIDLWQQHAREGVDLLSLYLPPRSATWAERRTAERRRPRRDGV